jgi:hypothetical protein
MHHPAAKGHLATSNLGLPGPSGRNRGMTRTTRVVATGRHAMAGVVLQKPRFRVEALA